MDENEILKKSTIVFLRALLTNIDQDLDLVFSSECNAKDGFEITDTEIKIIDPEELEIVDFRHKIDRLSSFLIHPQSKENISNIISTHKDSANIKEVESCLYAVSDFRMSVIPICEFLGSRNNYLHIFQRKAKKYLIEDADIAIDELIQLFILRIIYNYHNRVDVTRLIDDILKKYSLETIDLKVNYDLLVTIINDHKLFNKFVYELILFLMNNQISSDSQQNDQQLFKQILEDLDDLEEDKENINNQEQTEDNHRDIPDNHEDMPDHNKEKEDVSEKQETNHTDIEQEKEAPAIKNISNSNVQNKDSHRNVIDKNTISGECKYQIYTQQFDSIIEAEKLASIEEMQQYRAILDANLKRLKSFSRRSFLKLERKLLSKNLNKEQKFLEEGLLDASQLVNLITNNTYRNHYKKIIPSLYLNTSITFLVDNSGSMRGKAILISAICAELLGSILERVGIGLEVLGFTTQSWQGGQSRKLWENNKITNPGRLSDLLHIIYKKHTESWRKSKLKLGVMLKDSILKENIDGEALLWSLSRLNRSSAKRKILIVVSDGTPVDDSTLSVNSANYLDNHLLDVITKIEQRKDIDLLAIGIAHDVSRHYTNSIIINQAQDLANALFNGLIEML